MSDARPTRVLIAGAGTYGYWNTGDEAIFVAMLADLRRAIPGLVPVLVSANPPDALAFPGLRQVRIDDLPALVHEAHAADLMILGGGGIFYDYWGVQLHQVLTSDQRGLAFYAGFALTAALVGKPLMVYGVGVGPLASPDGQFMTRAVFDQAQLATVRDHSSRQLLLGLGHDPERIRVTADPACAMARAGEVEAAEALRRAAGGDVPRPLIGVAARNWDIGVDPQQWEGGVAAGLDTWLDRHAGTVMFLPFHRSDAGPLTDDPAVAERIIARMRRADQALRIPVDLSPDIKAAVITACDLVLGMRLHSLVFAASGGVPFAAIGYDPKVFEFLRQTGLARFAIELSAVSSERLVTTLEELYLDRDAIRARLVDVSASLAAQARDNAVLAAGLLTGNAVVSVAPMMVQLIERMHVVDAQLLSEAERRLSALRANLGEQRQAVQMLEQRVDDLDRELDTSRMAVRAQRETIQTLQEQLSAITSSTGWSVLQAAWRVRRLLAPSGSTREAMARWVLHLIRQAPPPRRLTSAPGRAGRWISAPLRAEWTSRMLRRAFRRLPAGMKAPLRRAYAALAQTSLDAASPPFAADPSGVLPAVDQTPALVAGRPRRVGVVNILTPLFFDLDGREMMRGGAERYLIELAPLIEAMGYRVNVYQAARGKWERRYGGLSVRGLDTGGEIGRLNARFHAVADDAALTIYLAFYLAAPQCFARSIGISHGVYWDHPTFQFARHHYQEKIGEVITAMGNLARIVSVDANTMNWVRATRIELAKKFVHLPNFVDTTQFRPRSPTDGSHGRLTALYPRRLYAPRGFWLVAEVLPALLDRFPDLEFRFVGQADPEEERAVVEFMRRHPGRVRWDSVAPEEMPAVYRAADITVIPTVAAEGTSLSCLEAQASGTAVIATNVGGLPELVQDGYNGLLIEPTAPSLQHALQRLVKDPALRRRLADRAVDVAQSYSLDVWRERWRTILSEHLPAASITPAAGSGGPRPVVFPAAPGVVWARMRQRPHHLAEQLAAAGWETYWEDPSVAAPQPAAGVHLVPARTDLPHDRPVVMVFYPYHAAVLDEFTDPFVVYDILDDISIHDRSDSLHAVPAGQRARDHHKVLLARADAVTVASRTLYEAVRAVRPDVHFVPNGVDDRWFDIRRPWPPRPSDLPSGAGPIIGYHGALGPWFDYALLDRAAGGYPGGRFVLIGPASDPGRLRRLLRRHGNVFYLGERSYDELPEYVAQFDIGILPFRVDAVTKAVRPLKVLECLAAGIPVAATAMPEITTWPGVVAAATEERFPDAIGAALALRANTSVLEQAVAFAREASWREAVQPLVHLLARLSTGPTPSSLRHSLR